MSIPEVFPRPTDPLRDMLADVLAIHDAAQAMNREEGVKIFDPEYAADAIIAALAQQGIALTREPGLLREAVRCWLAGDTKGLDGAMTDLAATVTTTAPQAAPRNTTAYERAILHGNTDRRPRPEGSDDE